MYEAKIHKICFTLLHPTLNSNRITDVVVSYLNSRATVVSATVQGKERTLTGRYSRTVDEKRRQHQLGFYFCVTAEVRTLASTWTLPLTRAGGPRIANSQIQTERDIEKTIIRQKTRIRIEIRVG